jgi:hypothetical protein
MERRELSIEERVLRGLGACGDGTWSECEKCPYQGPDQETDECWGKLCADAVALLKQKEACVALLDDALDECAVLLDKLTGEVGRARAEAVGGFLAHLKKNYSEICVFVHKSGEEEVKLYGYTPALLDELADEFLGRGELRGPMKKDYISAEEVRRMSLLEVEVNREVIVRSMKTWYKRGSEGGVGA